MHSYISRHHYTCIIFLLLLDTGVDAVRGVQVPQQYGDLQPPQRRLCSVASQEETTVSCRQVQSFQAR